MAATITSLMTGAAYKRSAELAGVVGPYEGYARNAESHQRVIRKHAAENDRIRTFASSTPVQKLATEVWKQCQDIGQVNGWRNAQASVLAPTGTIGLKQELGEGVASAPIADAVSALCNLGYSREQAANAVAAAVKEAGEGADSAKLIRLGLKELSR